MVQKSDIFFTGGQDKYRMVFPTPTNEEYGDKCYTLKEIYQTEDLYTFYLSTKGGNQDISLLQSNEFTGEEHKILIHAGGIHIQYGSEESLFRALTSLRQLINLGKEKKVPYAEIHDKPQFKYRGLMMDTRNGRHLYKPEFICKIIDYMAGLKYNELQLYMDRPDVFQYEAFPELAKNQNCLTAKDIKMLDQYCKERFIELVPNQNGFGHMRAWLDMDEFKHLEVTDGETKTDSLNILNPEAFELMDKIYASLLPHFSSNRIHIGLDEAFGLGRFQLEDICKEKGKVQVFMDWLNKLSELCEKKYGKKVQFWADMISEYPESFQQIPEHAMPVEWGYEDINAQLVSENLRLLKETGRHFYVAPSTNTWASITGRFEAAISNIRTYGEEGQKWGAEGYLLTIWEATGFVWELVPIALAAQYAWNVGIKQHCGWRKSYFVHNAQDYVDRYVLKGKVSRDICKVSDFNLMEPERVACGSIVQQMMHIPFSQNVKKDFYDVTEIFEEYHVDNIINSVSKVLEKLSRTDFDKYYKREFIVDAKTAILGAEYIRLRLNGGVSAEKAKELTELSEWIIDEREAIKKLYNYDNDLDRLLNSMKERQKELQDYILK